MGEKEIDKDIEIESKSNVGNREIISDFGFNNTKFFV